MLNKKALTKDQNALELDQKRFDVRLKSCELRSKKFEGLLSEMLYLVEHVDMVKYAMLSYFISYKTQNLPVIKKLLEQITAGEML